MHKKNLRHFIILGWVILLQLSVIMFVVSLTRSAINANFATFADDPGHRGMNIMAVVFSLQAVVPLLVWRFDARAFRWFVAGFTAFFLLFYAAHEVSHLIQDAVYMEFDKVLAFAQLAVLVWVTACAVRWARAPLGTP
jgi:hypothetical protein